MPVASIKARGRGSGRGPGQDVEEFEDVEKNFVRDLGELWAVALDLGLQMLPWALLWSAGVNHLRSTCFCVKYIFRFWVVLLMSWTSCQRAPASVASTVSVTKYKRISD